jgi:hypothetical protein
MLNVPETAENRSLVEAAFRTAASNLGDTAG